MRIMYCIRSLHHSGGMERVLSIKANWLAEHGYEVFIVTERQKGRQPFFSLDGRVKLVDLSGATFNGSFAGRLKSAIGTIQPDICISLCCKEVFHLPTLSGGRPCIAEFHFCHDKFYRKYSGLLLRPYARFRTKRLENALKSFDCLVTLTKADMPQWSDIARQLRQIYNPITLADKDESIDNQGNTHSQKRMVAVGRLENEKNFKDLIEAWAMVRRKHPDWGLSIFGEGKLREKLTAQIASLGLEDTVRLEGTVKNLAPEYRKAAALVMSSKHEGFPLVLVEACSFGLPMIAYDCPTGPSEIIADASTDAANGNGYLVEYGNVQQLAERICETIEDADARERMGRNAKKTAERFTPSAIMAQWEQLFSDFAGKTI